MSIHYYNAMSVDRLPELQASASDSTPSGSGEGATPCSQVDISSNTTVITASGGVPPYSYSWSQVGPPATAGPFTPFFPLNSDRNAWSDQRCDAHSVNTETWRCVVTDSNSGSVAVDVNVSLVYQIA